jgi:hypothetical protein
VKCKISHRKTEKKVNLEILGMDSQDSKGIPQSYLNPIGKERREKKKVKREKEKEKKKQKPSTYNLATQNAKLTSTLQHIKQEKEEDEDKGSSPFLFTIGFREEK